MKNKRYLSSPYYKDLSYMEIWGLKRKAGKVYNILRVFIYLIILYLLVKVFYQIYERDFDSFKFDWWAPVISFLFSYLYWKIHEYLYLKTQKIKESSTISS